MQATAANECKVSVARTSPVTTDMVRQGLSSAGLTPVQTIKTETISAARILGTDSKILCHVRASEYVVILVCRFSLVFLPLLYQPYS